MSTSDKSEKIRKIFSCDYCDYTSGCTKDFNKHLQTIKHKNNAPITDKSEKIRKIFICDYCVYNTSDSKDFNKHLYTVKHKSNASITELPEKFRTEYNCPNCNKPHNDRAGLWRHKKKCNPEESNTVNSFEPKITTSMIIELLKQNKDLQELLVNELRQAKAQPVNTNIQNTNTISNSNNTNNANFNLNVFLNEQCKNAVNLSDFINSLVVTAQDFERTGKVGFVEGISKIFLKGLRALDVYSRPIHCTDLKRESIYIKQDNVWVKEDSEKTHLNTAVKQLARKNLRQLVTWKEENPDCLDTTTHASDLLVKFSQTALGGIGEQEDTKFRNAIIKNIMKDVVVEKPY
jgi:ribosomal protein L37AE/L43A